MDLALFDFDGTITNGDTYTPFLWSATPRRRAIAAALMISPVVLAHRLGLMSTPKVRPIATRAAFRGMPAETLRALGRQYAAEELPKVLQPQAMERLDWHRQQGDTIAVVSAGLDVYLAPWCESHRLTLICSELEEQQGTLTGRYRCGDCSGLTKAQRVRETFDLRQFQSVHAYGDSVEDREMLALANRKYYQWQEIDDSQLPRPRH